MTKRQLIGCLILLALALFGIHRHHSFKKKTDHDDRQKSVYIYEDGRVHGTYYHIVYESPNGESLQTAYENEFIVFDLSVSAFNEHSIISRINKNDTTVRTNEYFNNVFNTARKVSEKTNGAFDMTVAPLVNAWGFGFKNDTTVSEETIKHLLSFVGYEKVKLEGNKVIKEHPETMLDASAIAKGYSSDVVAAILEKNGVKNYMVEIGGECVVKGVNANNKTWTLGITKPEDDSTQTKNNLQTIVELGKGGLATSGNYRRFYYKDGKKYAHTIDPKTGHPVEHNLLSATIYGPTCMEADAYATACMVLGVDKAMELIESMPEFEGYFIYTDQQNNYSTICTKGFEKLFKKGDN